MTSACQAADAADAAAAKALKDAAFRTKVEAASATDDECRSAVESAAAHVTHLRQHLDVAERAEADASYTREKSREVKAAIDREALERLRSTNIAPAPLA